jgi:hypothetical protein
MSSGTCPRISDGVAGVSPDGSPPAPPGLEILADSRNFLVVEGMTLPFDHAYTVPRTLPADLGRRRRTSRPAAVLSGASCVRPRVAATLTLDLAGLTVRQGAFERGGGGAGE